MQQARGQYSEAMTNLQKALKLTDTDPQLTDRQDFQRRVQKAMGQVGWSLKNQWSERGHPCTLVPSNFFIHSYSP